MLDTQFSLIFNSGQSFVSTAVKAAIAWVCDHGVRVDHAASIEIVLAEALNNVIEHAYEYREDGRIEITLDLRSGVLVVCIRDQGTKFPGVPQKKIMNGIADSFEDLPEGGFGWFLIHSLTCNIQYAFVDGYNVLTLELEAEIDG